VEEATWLSPIGPPTFQRTMTKAFKEYLDNVMKKFLDNFIIYSDMESLFVEA
jgi:hypothetical protein